MGQESASQEGIDWCHQMARDNPDIAELMYAIIPSSAEEAEKDFIEIANSVIKDSERNFFDRIKRMQKIVSDNTNI